MCINKINKYIENRRFIKYIITLTLGLPTIFKVCRQLFNLYTDCCYLFYMVSVQYLYFLAGCEPGKTVEGRCSAECFRLYLQNCNGSVSKAVSSSPNSRTQQR